jgi:hypothetical protein
MIETRAPLRVAYGVDFVFPEEMCCNCGATQDVAKLDQDTRVTRYMVFGGTEITMKLQVPVCPRCVKTVERRPVTLLHAFLVLLLAYFLSLGALLVAGLALDSEPLLDWTPWLSLGIAAILVAIWYGRGKSEPGQTSFYQPVRILKLRQEFVSGTVTGICFGFTNLAYSRKFVQRNHVAIQRGLVEVREL